MDADIFRCMMTFILPNCCYIINLILSALQLTKKGGYGYDGILSMLDDYPLLLEINEKNCNSYISDIEYKKKFAKIKTIFSLIYHSILIISYPIISIQFIKNGSDNNCFKEYFFCVFVFIIIIILFFFDELILVSMSLNYYNKTEYDSENLKKCNRLNNTFLISEKIFDEANTISKWVIKYDIAILSISLIYFFPLMFICISILFANCVNWCEDLSYSCKRKCDCSLDCCNFGNCWSGCCDKCVNCCTKCCRNDYVRLKNENDKLRRKIKELEKENDLLKKQNNKEPNNIILKEKILTAK